MAHVTKFRKTSLPFYICLDFLKFRDVSYMYFRAQLRTKGDSRNRIPSPDPRCHVSNWIYSPLRAGITLLAEQLYLPTFVFEILFSPIPGRAAKLSRPRVAVHSDFLLRNFPFFLLSPCPEKQKHPPAKILPMHSPEDQNMSSRWNG